MNVRPGLACGVFLLAAACRVAAPPTPPLAGAALGGPFALADQDGRAVTARTYAGRYRAIYFGYTFCPDVCPTTLQKLTAGYRLFAARHPAEAARLVPIFVSVDPARDTPPILKTYVAAFDPHLVGLTGTPAELRRMAKTYGASFTIEPPAKGASGYLVDHTSQVILYDPDGGPLALVPTDQDAAAVADTLAAYVR